MVSGVDRYLRALEENLDRIFYKFGLDRSGYGQVETCPGASGKTAKQLERTEMEMACKVSQQPVVSLN